MKIMQIMFIINLMIISSCTASAFELPSTEEGFIKWSKDTFGEIEFRDETEPISNYLKGKIVDQYGQPVEGVKITAGWMYMDMVRMIKKVKQETVLSDDQGIFYFQSTTEDSPSIEKFEKKGYEYNQTEPFYNLPKAEQDQLLLASKETPIEFHLRKLGSTTYLYSYGGNQHWFKEPNVLVVYNIFSPDLEPINPDLSKFKYPRLYDLALEVTKSGGDFTIRIMPLLSTGGMQVLDTLLYEAPVDSYSQEASLVIKNGEKITSYLYFKSRDPFVYSRMEMRMDANDERMRFFYETWTNPYGSRNLEFEPDIPFYLLDKLRKEATSALQSGKLPPEPNLQTLITSGLYD